MEEEKSPSKQSGIKGKKDMVNMVVTLIRVSQVKDFGEFKEQNLQTRSVRLVPQKEIR